MISAILTIGNCGDSECAKEVCKKDDTDYREVLEEDIRYRFWVNMAYGIKAFSYFTYNDSFCKNFSNSCVRNDISCSPHEQYYRAKKVNSEVHALEKVYLSFTWNGTMPIYGTNNEEKKNENFDGLNHSLAKIDILSKVIEYIRVQIN